MEWGRPLYFHAVVCCFFPRLISAAADWMSAILPHMVSPYCEFKMQAWNLLHAARLKHGTQKIAFWAPSHNFVELYLRNQGTYRQLEKKLVKQQYVLHMSPQYELQPTSGWDRFTSLGHPYKFQRVSRLGSVTAQRRRSPEANKTLHDVWPLPPLVDCKFCNTFSAAVAP